MANGLWAFPGLHYFEDNEIDRALFFGREKEIQQLIERIIAEDFTVLFGKSGDGKTSLINAGLKPAFRELGYLPVRARIFNLPEEKTPIAALYQTIEEEAAANQTILPPRWQGETLWESFLALRPTGQNGLKPIVLILDQFEELFTLMAGRSPEQEDFVAQLADLARGRMPETVREKYRAELAGLALESEEAHKLEQLLYGSVATVRILLSLREDYLAFLNNLGKRIPKVFASRYRLSSLTIEQARAAIANPPQQDVLTDQKFRIEAEAIEALLKFLTVQSSVSGVNEEVIGPPQLQVLCRQLEEQMRQRGRNSVSVADLGGEAGMRQLLSRYYRVILEKFPAVRFGPGPRRLSGLSGILRGLQPLHSPRLAVRRLCEERLITAGGNRNSRHEDEIIREIGVAPPDLQELVESRLLRREPRLQEAFYELSHDSLVPSLQLAGGMRQTLVTGLKIATIAAIIFSVAYWLLPYVQGVYEMRRLEAEFAAMTKGEVKVDAAYASYYRTRLWRAYTVVSDSTKVDSLKSEFDLWRKRSLQSAFLQADLAPADTLLQILAEEYPSDKILLTALADSLRERQIRAIQKRYFNLMTIASGSRTGGFLKKIGFAAARPAAEELFIKADAFLDSAYTALNADTNIIKLQNDLAERSGNIQEAQQLANELEVKRESTRKQLEGAIQIEKPRNLIVKGDSSGKASQFEIVLRYNPLLINAVVLLNGQPMSGEKISSDKENKLQSSIRQKAVSTRTDKFLSGMVTIPAGARQVPVRITAISRDSVQASQEFIFTVDREPPQVKTFKVLYKDTEKNEWKNMPPNEWRGNYWRIEARISESLVEASLDVMVQDSELAANFDVPGIFLPNRSEVYFDRTGKDIKIIHNDLPQEIKCTLKIEDLVGWQSLINLGKWKIAKTQAAQVVQEIKQTSQQSVIRLRSTPDENLTADEVREMLRKYDFYCIGGYSWSNPKGKGIANDFILQPNGQAILDRATGLMWEQSSSPNYMLFEEAQKYVDELNRREFAGFSDWRLPTLEEAMSLMEPKQISELYFDAKFGIKQLWIWTADAYSAGEAWVASFEKGYCAHGPVIVYGLCVRAVRSAQ